MVSMRSRRSSVDPSVSPSQDAAIGGAKTIGLVGGVALLINNITGSAMVLFPSLYQQAGWFVCTIALFAVAFLSYLCAIMIIESMAAMPGNHAFEKRVEYTTLAYYYLGRRGYYITQFFFQFSLAFNNMASIIQSVQVMDFAIVAIFKKSCAVPEFYPSFSFHCPSPVDGSITPFGDMYLLSIGFVLTAIVCLPLGFWNLDDNIKVQKVSCLAVSGMVFVWVGLFIGHWGLDASRVPAIGTQMSQVLGVVVFNFAVISSIPSWVNEKKEGVSILRTLGYSVGLALGLFTLIGIFGGMAFAPWFNSSDSDQTLLNKLQDSSSALAKFTFYFFPIVVDLTSIPVFAIMQRYNLLEAKVCSKGWANFIGVVLPWLVCIPFYTGSGFSEIINWGGIIFNSSINFVIPPLIYIAMVRKQTQRHQIATQRVHMSALTSSAGSPAREPIDEYAYGNEDSESAHAFVAPAPLKITVTRPSIVNGGRGDGSSVVGSMLGARSHNAVGASLKQSLLGGGDEFGGGSSAFGGSGAYHPSEVDVRSAEEEQKDEELLGYDPVEAERQEAEELEREIARRQSVAASRPHSPSMLTGSLTAAAASSSIFGRSRSPTTAAPSVTANLLTVPASDDSVVDLADDLDLLSLPFVQGWNAMPKWVIPYRVHLAAGVATLLVILSLIVIGVNIDQCVTQGC